MNYILSDVYSTAISLIQIYNPKLPKTQKTTIGTKREEFVNELETNIKNECPIIY